MSTTVNQPEVFLRRPVSLLQTEKNFSAARVSDVFLVNTAQIIPTFTHLWDDEGKSKGKKVCAGCKAGLIFLSVLLPFHILARFHDEATTSDYGGDIGDQFNIATSANEHGGNAPKKHNHEEGCAQEGAGRKRNGAPDPRTPRADAEPAGPDRCSQAGQCGQGCTSRRGPAVGAECAGHRRR